MIHVIAVITARPGKREAILQAFRANVPAVRREGLRLRRQDQRHDREPQGSWGDA